MAKAAVLVVMSGVAADLLARRYDVRGRAGPRHPARDPGHGAARPEQAQGPVRRGGSSHAADLRAAGAQQGHRDRDPRAAGGHRRLSRSGLFRGGGDPSRRRAPERRGLPHHARARGREAGRSRPRRVPRPVRHHRRAVQLPAGDRRLREPVPQRGPGDQRRAVVRDGRGRGGRVDALLARAGAAGGRPRVSVPLRRQRRPGQDDRLAAEYAGGARPGEDLRVRVHARVHLAADRRALPEPRRDRHGGRPEAGPAPGTRPAPAACPSCGSITCCA